MCLVSHLSFSSMPQPLRVFSLPWQIPAMGEDPEGVCIDFGSDLETPLAVPMLRAHDEHRITGGTCCLTHLFAPWEAWILTR